MAGRSQGLRLDPTSVQPVLQEPVQLCRRDRLGIPLEIANAVPWLAKRASAEVFALAVLEEVGKITLRSWEVYGPAVLTEHQRLIDSSDFESLRLLDDKYRRVQIPKDARITLTLSHILHLGLPTDLDTYVYVALVGESIQVFSAGFRDRQLSRAPAMFPELP